MKFNRLIPKGPNRIAGVLVFSYMVLYRTGVAAQSGRYDGWHPMMRGWGVGGFGMIINLTLWILAIFGVVWLIRRLFRLGGKAGSGANPGSQALDILNKRYARGEIDKSQYDAMKRDIMAP